MKYSKRRRDLLLSDDQVEVNSKPYMTFDEALEAYISSHSAKGDSKYTMKNYRSVIRRFSRYMADIRGHITVDQVSEPDVDAWLSELRLLKSSRGKPYSSHSIQTYCRDVLIFFHWLVDHGHLEMNPLDGMSQPKVEKHIIRVFTESDLKRLDAACDFHNGKNYTPDERKALAARDRAILWLLLSTGMRCAEMRGILFKDVDFKEGLIYIRGKGAKERRVPLGKIARQHLTTYINYWRGGSAGPDDHIFLTVFGTPIQATAIGNMFRRLQMVSGIVDKRVSPHTCRHWFAVNCIKNGMPTVALKEILGHENWDMIEVYVRLAEQDKTLIYHKFSPVDNLSMHHSPKTSREKAREWRKEVRRKGGDKE